MPLINKANEPIGRYNLLKTHQFICRFKKDSAFNAITLGIRNGILPVKISKAIQIDLA